MRIYISFILATLFLEEKKNTEEIKIVLEIKILIISVFSKSPITSNLQSF